MIIYKNNIKQLQHHWRHTPGYSIIRDTHHVHNRGSAVSLLRHTEDVISNSLHLLLVDAELPQMAGDKYALGQVNGVKTEEKHHEEDTRCLSSRVKFFILGVIVVGLICSVIVLAVIIANKDKKYDAREASYKSAAQKNTLSKVCLTQSCIESANRVNQFLDPETSPCENFYQFACGGWEKTKALPNYATYTWSVVDELNSATNRFFRGELEKPSTTSSFQSEAKARILYETCMEVSKMEELGLSEARKILDEWGGLSFNLSEPYPEFDLTERLIQIHQIRTTPLFKLAIDFHRHEPNTVLLAILPSPGPLLFSRKESEPLFHTMAVDVIKVWKDLYKGEEGPSDKVFLDAYLVMNDLKETADNDIVKGYKPKWNDTLMTVAELQEIVPQINWTRIITDAMPNKPFPAVISVSNKFFMIALKHLLQTWNPRSLDNFMKFSFVVENLSLFPRKYTNFQDNLMSRIVFSKPTWQPAPRWIFCVEQLKVHAADILGRWYIEDYLENEDAVVEDVNGMIEEIRAAYVKAMEKTQLLDKETRNFAIRKIKAMDKQVAFPLHQKNMTAIEILHEKLVANKSNSYFMNVVATARADPYPTLHFIGVHSELEWDKIWMANTFVANGLYLMNLNTFAILAGILQGAFYNLNNPKFMNYGSAGFIIGHEFTHGFDDTGRRFGVEGLLNPWWTNTSEKNYNEAKTCYQNQYSKLRIKASGNNNTYPNNGNATLDENLSDNGSEFIVFQAYENWVKEHGEEKMLPTPYLDTWQKQYHVAQAQVWCAKFTDSGLMYMLGTYIHSQKEARVNGMYQNSVRFAEIFDCPVGSPMNPSDKCKLW